MIVGAIISKMNCSGNVTCMYDRFGNYRCRTPSIHSTSDSFKFFGKPFMTEGCHLLLCFFLVAWTYRFILNSCGLSRFHVEDPAVIQTQTLYLVVQHDADAMWLFSRCVAIHFRTLSSLFLLGSSLMK